MQSKHAASGSNVGLSLPSISRCSPGVKKACGWYVSGPFLLGGITVQIRPDKNDLETGNSRGFRRRAGLASWMHEWCAGKLGSFIRLCFIRL